MGDVVESSGPQLGHLNLKVADLDRAIAFYCDLGFHVVRRAPGAPIAFLGLEQRGAFQIGLALADGAGDGDERRGLDHFALVYDSPEALARACKGMRDRGVEPVAAHEYGVSKSVYFEDPDGNGLELYYEYPEAEWPEEEERFRMRPLDLDALLASAAK